MLIDRYNSSIQGVPNVFSLIGKGNIYKNYHGIYQGSQEQELL